MTAGVGLDSSATHDERHANSAFPNTAFSRPQRTCVAAATTAAATSTASVVAHVNNVRPAGEPQTVNVVELFPHARIEVGRDGRASRIAVHFSRRLLVVKLPRRPQRILTTIERDGFYVRVPAGKQFYLYLTQTVDRANAKIGGAEPAKQEPQAPRQAATR